MKFDLNQAWEDAIGMLKRHSNMVAVIAGVFFFLPYFLLVLMTPEVSQSPGFQPGNEDPEAALDAMTALYAEIWWLIIIMAVMQGIGTLALYALLGHSNRPTVGEAIGFGVRGLLPFIGIGLLQVVIFMFLIGLPLGLVSATGSAVGIAVGSLIAVVAVVYLYTKFSLSVAVIGLEKQFNPVAAMRRSWALTKGNSLRLWLFYILLILAFAVVSLIITMLAGVVFGLLGPQAGLFGTGIVSSLLNAVFVCVFLAVLGAAYRQLSGGAPDAIGKTFE